MSNRHEFRELQDLLELLYRGQIEDSQIARLQELAQSNYDSMQFYIDYLDQHATLLWQFRRFANVFSESGAASRGGPIGSLLVPPASLANTAAPPRVFSQARLWPLAGAAVLAALLLLFWQLRFAGDADVTMKAIAGQVNSVKLESGVVTLALDKVGSVTVEGPADFELVGPLRARLNQGRIAVHVNENTGHGFIVETPDGEVIDFGTKFNLEVSEDRDTKLIVREGTVGLRPVSWRETGDGERLIGGEAVSFNSAGNMQRVMSVFAECDYGADTLDEDSSLSLEPLISSVSDNIRDPLARKYYEIVPRGLREDALAYVDRVHQWNGVGAKGLPSYLDGADYVRPFNDDKMSTDIELVVTLSRPATVYVFFDERLPPPKWLVKDFQKTSDVIGLDMGQIHNRTSHRTEVGPGTSVDHRFTIWACKVMLPGEIVLGANLGGTVYSGMYGMAAVELKDDALSTVDTSVMESGKGHLERIAVSNAD